eukprot:GHUV01017923.1.p1 GENE.GHUV01017923.1~~GHUV01017923.1.p1  ORF type:complete len:122 (-),score=1.51 GHUV01017923.1:82-447(-)
MKKKEQVKHQRMFEVTPVSATCSLVSMISLCAATSSSVFGLYFSTQGAPRPSIKRSTFCLPDPDAAAAPVSACMGSAVSTVPITAVRHARSAVGRLSGRIPLSLGFSRRMGHFSARSTHKA